MTETRFDMAKLPNWLTYGRIGAIPVIMLLILAGHPALRWLALILYVAAAITDFLDGYLARKYGSVSPIGRMLDPIADKLLVGALLLVFCFDGTFGVWDLIPATIILLREIFVSGLREFMGTEKIVVPVSMLAKYKTTVQLIAIGMLIAEPLIFGTREVSDILLWLAAVLTAITGWQYWQGVSSNLAARESDTE
ncbi:CDP-diacylglycerol--glycerol-3-phosphate 3-phosphatidyltransferase [Pelagibacterium xiamenense]|uniref:CDP-diacylglycerol--glycerol-3-phosphate 3-phosphatidyltransferase n=1 Tax=Pelagibacterium xiamenense TaxID=2901140 RepID=UPI001E4C0832|nr:CDP-diacylglycerol--glycerol-3-phosphate 3-phosphatidyltransferase [Pelagibacterium xiamenense]MCD7060287.1 CDP-diacylglycerol--glycerol-3-phosphate 3-phosphatidyltransferase [Pelagibacterium xiamenense]